MTFLMLSAGNLSAVKMHFGVRSIAKWFALRLPATAQSIRFLGRVFLTYDIADRISLGIGANYQFGKGGPS
jgi:hypothetical protein